MSDSERNYHWIEVSDNEEYQRLLRPDGTKVTTITEPEDRNFYRDLAPVVDELNTLLVENARLRDALNEACDWLKRLQEEYDPTDTEDGIADIERLRGGGTQ